MPSLITNDRAAQLVPQLSSVPTDQLTAQLASASAVIEAVCNRKFACGYVVEEAILTDVYGCVWLQRTPVVSGTLLLTDLDDVAINRWRLDTASGELQTPSHRSRHLKASYQGGYSTLPAELELAVANLARIAITRDASQADGEIAAKEIGSVKITYANLSEIGMSDAVPKSIMNTIGHLVMPKSI